ncbi:MAG TPA: MerR family transcriptional regulator [Gaiellaceae bacterium]|nr:MerR family transcriptional regulator [Gaiellaceae bacterium]
MSTKGRDRTYRIGELAERIGVTTRTIRYYEEIGLLATSARNEGKQRLYRESDVLRLQELLRLRDLLGLSLDELTALAEAEQARAALRDQWHDDTSDSEKAKIVMAAIPLVERQLKLVQARQRRLTAFRKELSNRLNMLRLRLDELQQG